MNFAERMARLGTESAFEVLARAKGLERQGKEIIHLEIGEPDFDTPVHILVGAAVHAAWVKHDVAQCGYCQSGQIMSATAFLKSLPRGKQPTAADIDAAMAGNICRCGTYARIRAAVADAAKALA